MQIWQSPPVVKLVAFGRSQRVRSFPLHEHPFYELGIVLSGECEWRLGRRDRVLLRAGEVILVKPGTLHCEEIRVGGEARLAWVGFDFEGSAPRWSNRAVATKEDFPEVAGYFDIIAREHHRADLPSSQVRVGLATQSLLLLAGRRAEKSRKVPRTTGPVVPASGLNARQVRSVESAAHYFRTNLQNALSIAQVAAYHSLCPAYFTSLFKRHHRTSPRHFLHQARLERAVSLLTETDLTLKEIAAQCGFGDAAHLCKSFKQVRGTTPRAYQANSLVRK